MIKQVIFRIYVKLVFYDQTRLMFRDPVPFHNFDVERRNKTEPLRSPNMVGCAFSIDREFFFEIGSYDEGLDVWGSENLELSLRVNVYQLK